MTQNEIQELRIFCEALYVGVAARVAYEILKVFSWIRSRIFPNYKGIHVRAVEDVLFFCGFTQWTFFFLKTECKGIPRAYAMAGIGLGIAVLHFVLKGFTMKLKKRKRGADVHEQSESKKREKIE